MCYAYFTIYLFKLCILYCIQCIYIKFIIIIIIINAPQLKQSADKIPV